jgi:YHS domain-containing protein
MKRLKNLTAALLTLAFLGSPLAGLAADEKAEAKPKPKPYTLKTCIISGEKLGEMGDPFVYVHENREIKFCCKGCLKDFKKTPAKYVKKIEEAEAKAKKDSKEPKAK